MKKSKKNSSNFKVRLSAHSTSTDEDNNEWSVFTGTEYADLEFKDFDQLTTYIQLLKDNYVPLIKQDYENI